MSAQETTDDAERLFHVAKLELLCEYRTESGVEVDAAGFVSFCYERQQFIYQDGTAARCIVRLVSQVNASSERTRRNAVPSDFVAARATLRTDEEINVVEAVTRHTACRKVFVLYVEPLLQSNATLVRVFVRAWQNTNRLGKSAAAWLLGALEYVAADYCADLRANEPSRAARAIDEFYVPRLLFARGQQTLSSANMTETCPATTASNNVEQKRAYVATQQVTEYYWLSVRRDVLAAQFSKYAKSASQRSRTTARLLPQRIKESKTLVDVLQESSRDLLVLSNALYDVARLVDAQIPTALAAPRCVDCVRFSLSDVPPTGQKEDRQKQRMFRQSYQSCIDVHLDSQQRGCVQFLQEMERAERVDEHKTLRYLALSRTDYVYNVRQRRIERSSWQRLCVEFEQRSTRTSADERMTFERRRTSPLCVDCIRADSNVLYERPSESLVDSQLWSASCAPPPSLGWRVALLGSDSSLRCGVRTAILAHIVRSAVQCALDSDNHRRANLWLAALQSQRTIDDVCSICVLRKTLDDDQLAGATLRDVFEFCAGRVPQRDSALGQHRDEHRSSVARAHRASWSDLRSVATLILCSDGDVLHWLNAVAQLNEPYDSALFVAQHERCRQWYHVVRRARQRSGSSSSSSSSGDSVASQFRVLARVAVVRCISDYWRLQFVDLLTCDALIVTYEALREIEDDNCSYLSAFHSDESGEPFSRETWMRCVQHYMAGIQERRLLDLIGDDCQQTFQNNVPLEAIYWQRVVVDQPPQPIRSGGTRNRPARRALIDRFADVLRYASLVGIDRNVAPDMSSVHRTWLDWLPHIDARTDVHRSFVAQSARTMLLQESGNGTRQSTAEHTIYVTPEPEHSAVLSTAYRLMAQLQDLQALRLADIATADGVLDLRYENQPPATHCQSFEQLKPTYRYALQWLEANQHVASMLLRNLSDQMLQRTARFLSQINVDFEEESDEATRRRRQAYHNEAEMDAAEHGEARRLQYDNARLLLASRAFHAMLRAASMQVEQERANDSDHPVTNGETGESGSGSTTDDQEYVQMHDSETESIDSIQLSETDGEEQNDNDDEGDDDGEDIDEDDEDDEEDNDAEDDEEDGVYTRHARRRDLPLVLNDVIRHATRSGGRREQQRLSAASVGERGGLFTTDANRALWRRFLDIESDDTRHERTVPRGTNAMREYLSDQPSSYSFESERPEEMRTLDRFDATTGVGYSRVRGERYALQRSETLRAGMPLPYRTCVTTVRDRHLITFLNRLASERHWLPDSAADRLASARHRSQDGTDVAHTSRLLGAQDTLHVPPMLPDDCRDAQSGVDDDAAPPASTEICLYASPLNDYEQFYRRLEPALLRDVSASFRVSRDGAGAHRRRRREARNYDAPLDMDASFDVETDDSNAPESFVADVYQRELGGDTPMQEALVSARNKPRAISATKATRAALHYTRRLRAHYNNTLRALYEERRQTLHLLIEQVRLLLANLLALSDDLIDRQQLAALQQQCPPLADLSTLLSPSVVSHAERETSTAEASVRDFETVGHTARRRRQEDAPLDECVDSSAHQTLCRVAEQCYAFFNDFVVDRYLKRARQQCVPSISASFLHWARQITRFRQNARWLTTDIAFVEEQRARLRNNQRTLRQTLARLSGAAQDSSHRYDDDEEHECPVCLDDIDASGVSVALYPCGHYCCWPCHVQECVEQHGVTTDSDHPETIGVADVGVRCFQCRYVLQREQRVYCVERRRRRPSPPGTPQAQAQASPTSPQASEASIRSEPQAVSSDERTPKRARLDESQRDAHQTPAGVPASPSLSAATAATTSDNVFVAMQFVFAKSESLLDVLKRNLCARFDACDDDPFRCVVYGQYAPMLHEVYRAVQRWLRCIGREHAIDLFYCVRAQDLLEQQSRAYVRDMSLGQNDAVCELVATSAANISSGSVGQQTAVRKRSHASIERRADAEHSDNANRRRGVQRRHAIVFQHVDLTHDLSDLSGSIGRRDAQDADCSGSADRYCHVFSDQTVALAQESRRAPPLSDVSHAILCETLVPRLTHDARALEMAALLEQRLIGPLHRRHRLLPPLRVIRLITTGGMDNQLHNLLVEQRNKTV